MKSTEIQTGHRQEGLAAAGKLPNGLTPLLTKSLPPHALDEHRANVCTIMEAMVRKHDKFGWEQMNVGMRQMIREDWLAVLADYPADEVRQACRMHTIEAPNKVPNEGHVYQIIMRERATIVARQPIRAPEPERKEPRVTAEQRAEILRRADFDLKRMDTDV